LIEIRKLWRDGQKIAAIKELRSCFAPRFNLRESKELLEELCS
jgi:ribosomal protein L7/L12